MVSSAAQGWLLCQRRKSARRFRAYRDFTQVRPDRVVAEPVQAIDGAPRWPPRILRSNQRFPELSRAGAHRSQASPAVSNMTASSAACAPSPDQATNWNAE